MRHTCAEIFAGKRALHFLLGAPPGGIEVLEQTVAALALDDADGARSSVLGRVARKSLPPAAPAPTPARQPPQNTAFGKRGGEFLPLGHVTKVTKHHHAQTDAGNRPVNRGKNRLARTQQVAEPVRVINFDARRP